MDFGFGIIETNPEESLSVVFHLNYVPVFRRLGQTQQRAVVNPRVACYNAITFTRFQQNSWQCFHIPAEQTLQTQSCQPQYGLNTAGEANAGIAFPKSRVPSLR